MKAALILKDGTVLYGTGFGAIGERSGELVFNTSMMGYEEMLTDPSYAGQILILTYPLIGNYGINGKDRESPKIHQSGLVVRQLSQEYQHREAQESLDEFLKEQKIPGISGIDTRFLVRHIREKGVMPATIITTPEEDKINVKKALEKLNFDYSSIDFVAQVSTKKTQTHGKGKRKIALIDFGVKHGIIDQLAKRDSKVYLMPHSSSAQEIKELEPDGIVLSNGPGDPAILTGVHKLIRELEGYRPMFGICLGNQLIAHAFGGDTYKLKFGHRGANHAVQDIELDKIAITTQNHGFAVGKVPKGFEVSHTNLNDKTIEGLCNKNKDIFCVQYHPEAQSGPHDSRYLFDKFMKMI
ncbi:glutamine-hydrolyzing carbamoyl-phosphate synthase small subunit [Candidatus Micrarchaeota archaeon]|nr:glutamine-hydrolyzing carbamoyl-phosphate synthase small subunit [Candidatus Micrarchaeota archaeon]